MKGFILKETVMLWTRNTKMCCINELITWLFALMKGSVSTIREFKIYDTIAAMMPQILCFNNQKQKLCTPFTCFFYFCMFLSHLYRE